MAATTKLVDGVEVPLTPAEAAAIEAEWADNAPGTGSVWTAQQAAALAALKAQAKSVLADVDADQQALARATRSGILGAADGDNVLRQWLMALKAVVAGISTLAQFKTAVAALPDLPEITPAQVRQAIRNRIDAE